MPEYKPRYKWRETWPGEGHQDFVGLDGDLIFGRIMLDTVTHSRKGMWRWSISHIPWVRTHILPHNGWVETAREASRMVEEHYEKTKAAHGR